MGEEMYQVLTKMTYGWENVWNDTEDGVMIPLLFNTATEAMGEILDVVKLSNGSLTFNDFKVEEVCTL